MGPMISEKFVLLGALLSLLGTLSYICDTIKGTTKPNRVSWFLWTLAPMLAFSAELKEGVGLRSLMTFMAGFMPLLVFLASFVNKKSFWKIERLDVACGFLSLVGLVLWLITKHGFFAISFAIMADALAAVPTLLKSFKDPESESYLAFAGGGISAFITLLTIKNWTYANYGFPIYILLICLSFVLLIRFRIGVRIAQAYGRSPVKA